MKKIILLFCILLFQCIQSQEIPKLVGTKWKLYVTEKNYDYIIFYPDSNYIDFDCELGERTFGKYSVIKDTVFLFQERGEYDDEFPEGSIHRAGKAEYKLFYKNGKLYPPEMSKEERKRLKKEGIDVDNLFYIKDETYRYPKNLHKNP